MGELVGREKGLAVGWGPMDMDTATGYVCGVVNLAHPDKEECL